ncbi:MAG: serine hydrolase domain-containing protein [Saprospiraceae bacterium]
MKNIFIYFLSFLFITPLLAQSTSPINSLIQQVENNLLPQFIIEGESPVIYNIEDRMKYYNVPGVSICMVKDGKIQWSKSYGYADKESGRKVVLETLFQAASISKPVAATAALQLVEKGKLKLDEDVNKYLKSWQVPENEFTTKEKVTLRRLVTHTAGLTVHGFRGYAQGEEVPTAVQVLNGSKPANSAAILPNVVPGTIWRYSGGGYTVMQQMLEDVTKKSFAQILQQSVLKKAGMSHSTYEQPLPAEYHAVASHGYRGDGTKVAGNWHTYPEQAAAGLWTTPMDLANFIISIQQSLQGKSKLLSKKMTEQMLTKHLNNMGLGPALNGEGDSLIFSHNGANEGFRCQMLGFARLGSGLVIMTNSDNGMGLIQEITRSVSNVYNWNTYKPRVKKKFPMDAAALEKFKGSYETSEGDKVTFEPSQQLLMATQSWDGMQLKFYPESENTFFCMENGYTVVFNVNNNEVESLTVNNNLTLKRMKE